MWSDCSEEREERFHSPGFLGSRLLCSRATDVQIWVRSQVDEFRHTCLIGSVSEAENESKEEDGHDTDAGYGF